MSKSRQGINQEQRLQQRLNLRQMQFGRLLEMSTVEFEEELERALEENPALTTVEEIEAEEGERSVEKEADDDGDEEEYGSETQRINPRPVFFNTSSGSSEADALEDQLAALPLSETDREIARYIIGNLDSSGYLTRSVESIADDMALTAGLDVEPREVERILKIIKSLEPAGIGAANLRECLLLQLSRLRRDKTVDMAREIIEKYYKQFINNRLDLIVQGFGIDAEDLRAAIDLIKSLNPKPGAGLFDYAHDEMARHITPDFIIEEDERGRIVVTLAGRGADLTVSPTFREGENDYEDNRAKEFIKERRTGAEEFISAVERRNMTLLKIMRAIIKLQPEFFHTYEYQDLKPMVIRDIESLTGLDKSVISRATSNKYMLTPDGIFPVKSLFGENVSAEGVLSPQEVEAVLRKVIEEEDKKSPMNDDDLTAELNARGLKLARRTVTKYREKIGIPPARFRKITV